LWSLALCGVLLWIDRRSNPAPGRLMGMYVVGYGIGRFWVESLRIDTAHHLAGLRWNQWVALATIAGGLIYLFLTRRAEHPSPSRTEDTAPEPEAEAPDLPANSS
jgi:prolipoprotein diacylglyceryltransferase